MNGGSINKFQSSMKVWHILPDQVDFDKKRIIRNYKHWEMHTQQQSHKCTHTTAESCEKLVHSDLQFQDLLQL
jgi:hypothetical protein